VLPEPEPETAEDLANAPVQILEEFEISPEEIALLAIPELDASVVPAPESLDAPKSGNFENVEALGEEPTIASSPVEPLVSEEPEISIPLAAPEILSEPRVFEEGTPQESVEVLRELAQQAAAQGNTPEAIEYYSRTLDTYRANNDVNDELAALESLALLSLQQGDYEHVLAYIDQGTVLAQQTDNPQREGHLLVVLGDMQSALGKFSGAENAYHEALRVFEPAGAWHDIGQTYEKLGELYLDQDRVQDAISAWQTSLTHYEQAGQPDRGTALLELIGDAHVELMQWDQAIEVHQTVLERLQTAGNRVAVLDQIRRLGEVAEESGRPDVARSYYRRALDASLQIEGEQAQQAEVMLDLARLMIDDTSQLNRVTQLLEAAAQRLPDNADAQRLLGRARTRLERLVRAGVELLPAEDTLEEWAASLTD
jgi:tetratricopeptide (TPR) repeat protein